MAKNNLKSIAKKAIVGAGLVGMLACDAPREITLDEVQVEGDVTVRLIQEVIPVDKDSYRLEVLNNKGNVVARLNSPEYLPDGTMIKHDNGKTYLVSDFNKRGYVVEESKQEIEGD